MDFTKYVDLASTGEMFYCRSDLLGDPFEGSSPEKHHERRIEEIRSQATDFQREVAMYVIAGMDYRKYVYVNCWHMSEYESAALWRLYLKSDEGIAVQSTRSRLGNAGGNNKYSAWGIPVQYIDYFNDDPPMPTRMAAFRYKRKSFEHEKEFRSIIYTDVKDEAGNRLEPPAKNGIRVTTNLGRLIVAVHLAPTAPDWLYDLTLRVTRKFQIEAPVFRSSLTGDDSLFI